VSEPSEIQTAPPGVPSNATWDDQHRFWRVGEVSADGVLQGTHLLFRASGALLAEVSYADGKAHGRFTRYHPNGEVAREGSYRLGAPTGREVAYGCSASTDEPLQKCCVPPGAVKLVLQHLDGGNVEEDFYDAQGRALLPDGELRPERPATVAPEARYKPNEHVWRTEVYAEGKRSGTWQQWSATGELVEIAQFQDNHLHGLRERWREGGMLSAWNYAAGVRHGSGWELVPPNTYENAAIARQYGEFCEGSPKGVWSYLDARGATIISMDLGPPLCRVNEASLTLPTASEEEGIHPLRRYFFSLQRASRSGKAAVERVLADRPAWLAASSERWLRAVRNERLDKDRYLSRLLEGLRRGATAHDVLSVMARLCLRSPAVSLAIAEIGLLLETEHVELLVTRALALMELGRLEEVKATNQRIERLDLAAFSDLSTLLRVTFPRFGFWPDDFVLDAVPSDKLPSVVVQDVAHVRVTMMKVAKRLQTVRAEVERRVGAVAWLPPDLSAWFGETVCLDRYEFDVGSEDGANDDHVLVDETLVLEGYCLTDLMNRARIEWVALCWLAFGSGNSQLCLPDEIKPQSGFGCALTTAFARLFRVVDQLETRGYRARSQGLPDAQWEGFAISGLPERMLTQAQAEFSEMRAALYFLADGDCRSLWQDDLRG
jgi:antitoxin component YwqK of YwqJK toxin-antitoxin module